VSVALAIIEPKTHPSHTEAEMRARSILSRMESLAAKLKTLEADIRLLWIDFDNLKAGETILGCATKKEFCEKKLHRTPRAIRYMLAGGNPDNHDREEIISPPEQRVKPEPPPQVSDVVRSVAEPQPEPLDWTAINQQAIDQQAMEYERVDSQAIAQQAMQEIGDAWRKLQDKETLKNALLATHLKKNNQNPESETQEPAVQQTPAEVVKAITAFMDKLVRNMSTEDALSVYQQVGEELKQRISVENIA